MKLQSIDLSPGKVIPGSVRLQALIASEAGSRTFWIEYPDRYASELSVTGNPWLLVMAALAAQTGEPIESALPVDGLLLENVRALLQIWAHWHPYAKAVEVHAPTIVPSDGGERTMCFFSGGVDSFFSVLRRTPGAGPERQVGRLDDLVTMLGLDLFVDRQGEFEKMLDSLRAAAAGLGVNLIWGATNLRSFEDTLLRRAWGPLTSGIGLGLSALALEKRFRQAIIPSSHPYVGLTPRGSHPLTDVLFGTSQMNILHDGSGFTRCEKTELVACSRLALKHLRVCWKAQTALNCGRCNKCMRALATFDALGVLDQLETFDVSRYRTADVARIFNIDRNERDYFVEIGELAQRVGRLDLGRGIDRSLTRSKLLGPIVRACDRNIRRPGLGRISGLVRSLAMAGRVH